MSSSRVLILPGLSDSGPEHWQSIWQEASPGFVRVTQAEWDAPRREDWVAVLEQAVARHGPDVVLVGHSTACALVAFWSAWSHLDVRGALLVGPSDTEAPSYPPEPVGWRPMPLQRLRFPSIVAASSNDPFVTMDRALTFAAAWGSRLEDVGPLGHINSSSGLGSWPDGRRLLDELLDVSRGTFFTEA